MSDTVKVKLRSTEVVDGVKRRPGDVVDLPADHPVAQKVRAAEETEATSPADQPHPPRKKSA